MLLFRQFLLEKLTPKALQRSIESLAGHFTRHHEIAASQDFTLKPGDTRTFNHPGSPDTFTFMNRPTKHGPIEVVMHSNAERHGRHLKREELSSALAASLAHTHHALQQNRDVTHATMEPMTPGHQQRYNELAAASHDGRLGQLSPHAKDLRIDTVEHEPVDEDDDEDQPNEYQIYLKKHQ